MTLAKREKSSLLVTPPQGDGIQKIFSDLAPQKNLLVDTLHHDIYAEKENSHCWSDFNIFNLKEAYDKVMSFSNSFTAKTYILRPEVIIETWYFWERDQII